jgi:hypothetical protein
MHCAGVLTAAMRWRSSGFYPRRLIRQACGRDNRCVVIAWLLRRSVLLQSAPVRFSLDRLLAISQRAFALLKKFDNV